MKISGHIRKKDLDKINNDNDAYENGVPIFFGSTFYRDDIEYIGCIADYIRTLFPEIPSSEMLVCKLGNGDSDNYCRHTMVCVTLDVNIVRDHLSEYIII